MAYGAIIRDTIFAKIESTYGVDPTIAGADAVQIREVTHGFSDLRMVESGSLTGSLAPSPQQYGGALESVTLVAELKGSGTAGTPPRIGPLLRACGLSETVVAGTSVTYAPQAGVIESCAIEYYKTVDGSANRVRHRLLGCRGSLQLSVNAGELPTITFTLRGRRAAPADVAALTPTYETSQALGVRGGSVSIGGASALVVPGFTFDLGNDVQPPPDVNDSEGYGRLTLVQRDPVITLQRHDELVATIAPYADLVAGTSRAFDTGVLGSVAGNRWRLQAPALRYRGLQAGTANGQRTIESVLQCAASTIGGNDNFTLTFT